MVTGLGALILALVPTWPGAIAGAVVFGIGYGVYLSVDFALCTEVLPAAEARAKDLGVINIAVALPQVFAPFVGSFLIAYAGGYVTLYAVACGVCLLGSRLRPQHPRRPVAARSCSATRRAARSSERHRPVVRCADPGGLQHVGGGHGVGALDGRRALAADGAGERRVVGVPGPALEPDRHGPRGPGHPTQVGERLDAPPSRRSPASPR